MLFTALLALCDLLTLPFYSIQAHLPEDNSINLGLSPPPWIINKEQAHGANLRKTFSQLEFPPPKWFSGL